MTHTSTEQPEAFRLAEHLEKFRSFPDDIAAAAELRRQHARILELEAAQAGRVVVQSDSSKVIADDELEKAFYGTNFGTTDYRGILHTAVLKKACHYHCGHTITEIMRELRLINANGELLKRGVDFLRASYHQQMLNGV